MLGELPHAAAGRHAKQTSIARNAVIGRTIVVSSAQNIKEL
jgi:hypothetical protein